MGGFHLIQKEQFDVILSKFCSNPYAGKSTKIPMNSITNHPDMPKFALLSKTILHSLV